MIIVHHLETSRSHRILWLLEEMGLDYEVKVYKRDPVTMLAPPELKAVHPLGKSPVISDGVRTLAESGLAPTRGSDAWVRFIYWLHFAEGTAMPPLLMKLVFDRIETAPLPFFARPIARAIARKAKAGFIAPRLAENLDFMEAELGRSEWFAGDAFSAADIQMSYPIEASQKRAGLDATRPKLTAFLQKIRARPAYQRAVVRGGGGPMP